MADSIGAVTGIKGEERSLGSLAGLEAQPLHKAKAKVRCGLRPGRTEATPLQGHTQRRSEGVGACDRPQPLH